MAKGLIMYVVSSTHMTLYSDLSRLELLAQEGKKFLVEHLIEAYR